MQTIKVLNRNYLTYTENTPVVPTSITNVFQIQGTAVFVGSNFVKEIAVETATVDTATSAPSEIVDTFSASDFISMMANTSLSANISLSPAERDAVEYIKAHVRAININVGDSYRYYTRSNNRWNLAHFEMTGTDIGRIVSGFAIKSPSKKAKKKALLSALNTVYGLNLTASDVEQSVNN